MNAIELTVETAPSPDDVKAVLDGLVAYNVEQTRDAKVRNLVISAKNEQGEIVGGFLGEIAWGWLETRVIWVEETLRHQGLGSKLLLQAETEARADGCYGALLDTFSFQALPFYLNHGYEIFGDLENYPRGHHRYFLRKNFGGKGEEE
jgi:GNAT superfamily N-acetyltransferase